MPIDPLTLLLIIVFVVLPLINSLTRRQQPGQRPPGSPEPDPDPPPQATTRPEPPSGPEEELVRRIEEARRRVQQALGAEPAPPQPMPAPPKPPAVPRKSISLETREPLRPTTRQAASLETLEPLRPTRREAASLEKLDPWSPIIREAAPPEIQRRAKRHSQPRVLSFDRLSLVRGVIWREIFNKPLAKRRSRR